MAMSEFVKPLLNVELFQGLRPLQISEIARRADRIVYKPGDVIARRDTAGDAAILIIAGDASRMAGPFDQSSFDERLPPGSLIGEMAMLIETDYSSTIIARAHVRALRIKRSEMLAQMLDDPALADHLVQRIAARLTSIAETLRGIDDQFAKPAAAFAKMPSLADTGLSTLQPALH